MKDQILWLDSETFSPTPLKNGTWIYAEKAEVMVLTYAFGDGPVGCWDLTDPSQKNKHVALTEAMLDPEQEVGMQNGGNFDSTIFRLALGIYIPPERILDVMVQALSHGMPGSLDILCQVLGVADGNAKHKNGRALIQLFCKPQAFKHEVPKGWGTPKARKAEIERQKALWLGRATRHTHPEKWQEFLEYAKADITAMREVHKRLPRWNYPAKLERDLWNLDQKINQRGICIDLPYAQGAVEAAERAKGVLAKRTQELTSEEVQAATQRDSMLVHILAEYGIALPDMQKATLERRIADPDLPTGLKELLNVRLQSCSTSVSKYTALIRGVSSDGRLRGTLQFSGAQRTKRDCLAEGTLVKVKTKLGDVRDKPIQEVLLSDKVWDGDAWVSHEGVVFSGEKEVIFHDGILATEGHKVYLSTSECVTLGEAKNRGLRLWEGNKDF